MSKRFGKAFVTVNGELLESLDGASIDLGGITRQAVVGNGYYGHAEAEKEATVACEIAISAATRPEDIHAATALTVVFRLDTGQTYVISGAVSADPPTITGGTPGKAGYKFIGPRAEAV
ncbi:MAG: phage tail tube protein [Nitrospirota bacterium]|nr:phage tail tube protein [Nitrospirota bacterium]